MKSKTLRITAALLLIISVFSALSSCEKGTDVPVSTEITEAPAAEKITTEELTTAEETTEEPKVQVGTPSAYNVIHKTVYNAALDWNGGTFTVDKNGGIAYWNIGACKTLKINFLNVFANYKVNGTTVKGSTLLNNYYESVVEYCAPALAVAKEMGMKTTSSLPMCLLNIEAHEKAGMNWKEYSVKNSAGNYVTSVDKTTGYACINNPKFQELVRKASVTAAKGGLDGMFYDANPYAYGVGYNCCCDYCKQEWAEYSKQMTGASIAIPTTTLNLSAEGQRLFFMWRLDNYIDFVLDVQKECQKYNPEFSVWPNLGINGTPHAYYTLKGLEDMLVEYGARTVVASGEESTLYFFRQYEALNPNTQLMTQFNGLSSQVPEDYMYYTAYAEAVAGNGALMAPTTTKGTQTFFKFIDGTNTIKANDTEAFADSASAASVAIVYSWQNIDAYTLRITGTLTFLANSPRKAAVALARTGIPYDYICAEKNPSFDEISQYSLIIIPDLTLLDKEFEATLYDYIQNGGKVLILGTAFGRTYTVQYGWKYAERDYDVAEKWTGTKFSAMTTGFTADVGLGKVAYVKSYLSGASESVAKVSEDYLKMLETLGAYDLVKVTEDREGYVETTLRSNADGSKWWLHLITYGSKGVYEDKPVTVTVTIPFGQKVTAVTGVSPTVTSAQQKLTWSQDGDKLTISVNPGLWSMIRIEKK